MKKILFSILSVLLLTTTVASAQPVKLNCNVYEKNQSVYMYHNIKVRVSRRDNIETFWWTGNEFLLNDVYNGGYYVSSDMTDWTELSINDELRNKINTMYEPAILYCDRKYIVFDKIYFNPTEIISAMENGSNSFTLRPLIVLDNNFNIISEYRLTEPLTDFEYVNGKYYIQTQSFDKEKDNIYSYINKIYSSNDAVNWSFDTLKIIPISNGKKNELLIDGKLNRWTANQYRFELKNMQIKNNQMPITNVVFEDSPICYYKTINDIYISYVQENVNTFRASMDGVYYVEIEIPKNEVNISGEETLLDCYCWKDKLVLRTTKRLIEYEIKDVHEQIALNCPLDTPYIMFSNNILSFATPPVIEDGSTLVPMRFLFEQMGADVDWNGATRTATATLDDTAVTFSIDNTQATVNKAPAKMAVPARLIDDKTMVPLRFLSEELGFTVTWDADTRTAIIE